MAKNKRIYLDYAATTPLDPRVFSAMRPYFLNKFGNTMSLHSFGQEAKLALESSRKTVADLIGARADEIVFTSSATESNNLALKGVALANKEKGNHIVISSIEHPCIMESAKWLENNGFLVTRLPVDKYGLVDVEDVKDAIKKETVLVSVLHASNEIGTIQPVSEIGKVCQDKGVLFHTDATQTLGKLEIDVNKMNIDLLSASAHKLYGPKGVGCLFVRKRTKIDPILHGGGQEGGLRSSTVNVPGIIGLAKACEIAKDEMKKEEVRLSKLRDKLIKGILKTIPNSYLNGHPTKRLPNNVNIRFDFVEGESIIIQLDMEGVAVSTGSACSSDKLEASHVLLALGLKHEQAHGSLRITFGRWATQKEVGDVLRVLPGVISQLREISPFKKSFKI